METPSNNSISFSILSAISNVPGHKYGYYRILTASSTIKYLSFLPSKPPFPKFIDDRCDRFCFSTIPGGDWNIGRLSNDPKTNQFILKRQFGAEKVVLNTDWYPEWIYGVIQETMVYAQIEGYGIGPKFLAHVTEKGERVYGYMLERVPARHATIDDLQACKAVLAKLHSLEIFYGHLSSDSFLILDNGQALLHCFGGSFATDQKPLFEREMESVEDNLRRGLPPSEESMTVELRTEISAISERDDGIHSEVIRQAAENGKITVTEEQHRELPRVLREELRELYSHRKPFKAIDN